MKLSSHIEKFRGANFFYLGFDNTIQSSPCNVTQFLESIFFLIVVQLTLKCCLALLIEGNINSFLAAAPVLL